MGFSRLSRTQRIIALVGACALVAIVAAFALHRALPSDPPLTEARGRADVPVVRGTTGGNSPTAAPSAFVSPDASSPGFTPFPEFTSSGAPTPLSTVISTTTGTSSSVSETTPRPSGSKIITWIESFTPAGGGGNIPTAVYYEIANGRCADALASAPDFPEPMSSVFAGAAAACLAAFHGRADLWPTAYARLDAVSGATGQLDCYVRDLHRMLLDIVTAHRQDPAAAFGRQRPAGGTASTGCPVVLAVEPHHGPASGREVRLVGQNLGPVVKLYVIGEDVWTTIDDVSTVNGREATVLLELPDRGSGGGTRVGIKVSSWPFEPVAEYTFDEETPDRASSPRPTG